MTTITLTCTDQALKAVNRPTIASGGVEVDKVQFIFCEKWLGCVKTAVFYRTADEVYHVLLDNDDTCVIPKEVLRCSGMLHIGVFGCQDQITRPSEIIKYWVEDGAITEATAVCDPTPDIYSQLLAKIGDLSQLKTWDKSSLVAAINEIYTSGGGGSGSGGMAAFEIGHGLQMKDNTLSVKSVSDFKGDNTLPATASLVQTTVGNIETLLATI